MKIIAVSLIQCPRLTQMRREGEPLPLTQPKKRKNGFAYLERRKHDIAVLIRQEYS
jgi:hypothetical protein